MEISLMDRQIAEVREVLDSTLREMSHEISATDNARYRARLMERRTLLEQAARALRPVPEEDNSHMPAGNPRGWTVEVTFTEGDDRTRAEATMRATKQEWHGWGRARRNPTDPDVPAVGEELAAARALTDLAHQLVDAAAGQIESYEGHPVHLHS